MKKYFFDTNFLFGLFNENDTLHKNAVEKYLLLQADSYFITSELVLAELLCSGENIDFLDKIKTLNVDIISSDLETIVSMEKLISANKRRSLKAIDSIILAQCKIYGCELISFDEKLNKVENSL